MKKAQPQVPTSSRYHTASPAKELPPYEPPPVYENIQDVQYTETNKGKARPQVASTYYNNMNINGGDYVVMTGKLGSVQGQKAVTHSQQKLDRSQNYDNLFQRSFDQNLCYKNLSTSLDQQNNKSTYVPPSELQHSKKFSYEQPQHQYSPRSSLSYYAPEQQYQHYRGASLDGPQHGHCRQENTPVNKQYIEQNPLTTSTLNSSYYNELQSRNLSAYNTSRAGDSMTR